MSVWVPLEQDRAARVGFIEVALVHPSSGQFGAHELGLEVEPGAAHVSILKASIGEVRTTQVLRAQMEAVELAALQVRIRREPAARGDPAQVCTSQSCLRKVLVDAYALEDCPLHGCFIERGITEARVGQVGLHQRGAVERCTIEDRSVALGAGKMRASQVRSEKVHA